MAKGRFILLFVGLALFLLITGTYANTGVLAVHFIDVGHGDAILIRAPGGLDALIDAGGRSAGLRVVEYLRAQGVERLKYLISSHPHSDHAGGLSAVANAFPVELVLDNGYYAKLSKEYQGHRDFMSLVRTRQIPLVIARAGQNYELAPGVRMEVLGPVELGSNTNDNCIVIRLVYGQVAYMLAADAEFYQEWSMLATGADMRADVLKVAHHGAPTSNSRAFLAAVRPTHAIISCPNDDWLLPNVRTLSLLKRWKMKVYRTDWSGTIVSQTDGVSFSVQPVKTAYLGVAVKKVFHRLDCGLVTQPEEAVSFKSKAAALKAKYKACAVCQP